MNHPQAIFLLGFIITGALYILSLLKKLRNNKTLIILLILTLILAFIAIIIRNKVPLLEGSQPIDTWFSPFIFILSYGLLRIIYKKKYNVEPTFNPSGFFDFEDLRDINALDVMVHLGPLFLSILLPLIF